MWAKKQSKYDCGVDKLKKLQPTEMNETSLLFAPFLHLYSLFISFFKREPTT